MSDKLQFTMKVSEALKMYEISGNKVSRSIFTKWINKEGYGIKGEKQKGIWYLNELSVMNALSLYEAVRTGTNTKQKE